MSTARPRASSTSQHGLGITLPPGFSSPAASSQQQQPRGSRPSLGAGHAHPDPRRSIASLTLARRGTSFAPSLGAVGRQGSVVLGGVREDEGEVDESRLDPEEVLRGLSVGEARRVEARLRSLALSKQQELRTMVGERYRDLLSSSAALATLFDASARLSQGLGRMREVVGDVERGEVGGAGVKERSDGAVGEELSHLLPLASQTKLLLDAPELIYRLLENSHFLPAAHLFSLCRLVHSELSDSGYSEDGVDGAGGGAGRVEALVEGQWETLHGLRGVISARARASLKDARRPQAEQARTIVALVQLDSLSLGDALQLVLSLRARLLADLLPAQPVTAALAPGPSQLGKLSHAHRHPSKDGLATPRSRSRNGAASRSASRGPSRAPSRASSRAPSRAASPARPGPSSAPSSTGGAQALPLPLARPVADVVREAVAVIADTVRLARAAFDPAHAGSSGGSSALERLIRGIEAGEPTPADDDAVRRSRRDSRLASLAMPFPTASPSLALATSLGPTKNADIDASLAPAGSKPLITTRALLQTLPSAPLLLRYLPRPVLEYTPLLLSSDVSRPDVPSQLGVWLADARGLLARALESLVRQLTTVKDVWALRAELAVLLEAERGLAEEEKAALVTLLERAWAVRVRELSAASLAALESVLSSGVRAKLPLLAGKEGEHDAHPPKYTFSSSIPFPSPVASSSSAAAGAAGGQNQPASTLPTFRTALRKRVAGRTPLIDAVVRELEGLADGLRVDVGVLSGSTDLEAEYAARAQDALDGVAGALKGLLEEVTGDEEEEGARKEVFVGRVAAHLRESSSFERDVRVFARPTSSSTSANDPPSSFADQLQEVHALSLSRWRARAVRLAVGALGRLWEGDAPAREAELGYAFQPSATDASLLVPSTVPSPPVLAALHTLVTHLQALGLPPSVPLSAHGTALYAAFSAEAQALAWVAEDEGKVEGERTRTARAADALFLAGLMGGEGAWGLTVDQALAAAAASGGGSTEKLRTALGPVVAHGLQRTQTLLLPLLSPSLSAPSPAQPTEKKPTLLLPLGPPPPFAPGDVASALQVAAPSPRFGLLAVGR